MPKLRNFGTLWHNIETSVSLYKLCLVLSTYKVLSHNKISAWVLSHLINRCLYCWSNCLARVKQKTLLQNLQKKIHIFKWCHMQSWGFLQTACDAFHGLFEFRTFLSACTWFLIFLPSGITMWTVFCIVHATLILFRDPNFTKTEHSRAVRKKPSLNHLFGKKHFPKRGHLCEGY